MLSCVWLFATPWTIAHQAPLSMEFSRQENWSGLPWRPPRDLPNPNIEPRPSSLQANSLLSDPSGKPKNTGVGSLSLLHGNFPTQDLNWSLLHCRQFLYQLSYLGSPELPYDPAIPLLCIYPKEVNGASHWMCSTNVSIPFRLREPLKSLLIIHS